MYYQVIQFKISSIVLWGFVVDFYLPFRHGLKILALTALELHMWARQALNLRPTYLYLPNAEIKGWHHYTQLSVLCLDIRFL